MEVFNYLSTINKKTILVTKQGAFCNELLANYARVNGAISNVYVKSIKEIASEIVSRHYAFRLLSKKEQAVILYDVLDNLIKEQKLDLISKRSLTGDTAEDLVGTIDLMNSYHLADEWYHKNTSRVHDACVMEKAYQERLTKLQSDNYRLLDGVTLINEANTLFDDQYNNFHNYNFVVLDSEILTENEKILLNKVCGNKIEILSFDHKELKEKYFVKSYGLMNEMQYVAEQIINKKLNFGEVSVYVPSAEYYNYASTIFETLGINYAIDGNQPATQTDALNLVLDLLAFLGTAYRDYNVYPYEMLQKIVSNKELYPPMLSSYQYYSGVHNDITCIDWGIERYEQFFEDISDKLNEKNEAFFEFLKRIIRIVDEEQMCVDFLTNLGAFLNDYLNQSEIKMTILGAINEMKEIYGLLETRVSAPIFNNIVECFNNLTYASKSSYDAVEVTGLTNLMCLNRKYNFFLGMSSSQMGASSRENVLIPDEDIVSYCASRNSTFLLPTPRLANEKSQDSYDNFLNSLQTNADATMWFSHSVTDTLTKRQMGPSIPYMTLFKKGETNETTQYDYIKTGFKVNHELVKEELNKMAISEEVNNEDNHKDYLSFSPTSLQMLIECPIKYKYKYLYNLNDIEQLSFDPSSYLPASEKGTFVHGILEKYFHVDNDKTMCDGKPLEKNEEEFARIMEDATRELEKRIAAPNDRVKNFELLMAEEQVNSFVDYTIRKLQTGKYYVLANEYNLKGKGTKNLYHFKREDNDYSFVINGMVDRIDGYVEDEVLHLCIVDYKTGREDKLREKVADGIQVQHKLYANAIGGFVEDERERIIKTCGEFKDFVLDYFVYVFPFAEADEPSEFKLKFAFENEYKIDDFVTDLILDCVYTWQNVDIYNDLKANEYLAENHKAISKSCAYCPYAEGCTHMMDEETEAE